MQEPRAASGQPNAEPQWRDAGNAGPGRDWEQRATSFALLFILGSQVFFATFVVYNCIVFFQPAKIVAGTVSLASAVLAILISATKLLPANAVAVFENYVHMLYCNLRAALIVMLTIWVVMVGWSFVMSKDVFGRIVYAISLQKAMDQGTLDRASLPDTAALAKAFSTFPNRREVPLLLNRSSRLLFQAHRRDLFRSLQRNFLDQLKIDRTIGDLCRKASAPAHSDGLIFLAYVTGDAYAPNPDLTGDQKTSDVNSVIDKFKRFIDPLGRCRPKSLEANVQRILIEDAINGLLASIEKAPLYDIDAELKAFDDRIKNSTDEQAVLEFWQSHGAQQYLDLKSYRVLSVLNSAYGGAAKLDSAASTRLKAAVADYETLLLLRQSGLRSGDVIWNVPPFKLNLFYAFMLDANIGSLVWQDEAALFTSQPDVKAAMSELTSRKVFEEFKTPRGWYAGTPLDFNLNGTAVADKINAWLKLDW